MAEKFDRFLTGVCGEDFEAFFAQAAADSTERESFIVDNQNRVGHKLLVNHHLAGRALFRGSCFLTNG